MFLCVRRLQLSSLHGAEEEAQLSHLATHGEQARLRVFAVRTFCACLHLSVCVHAGHTHTAIILHGINIHLCVH